MPWLRPTPRILTLLAILGLAAVTGCGGPAAPVPSFGLIALGDTVLTPYGDITGAAWLGGTRWVVIAPQDRAVSVADFARHSLARFGGRRASEISQPFALFRAGDSVFVADWLRRRLTDWSLAGDLGGSLPAVDRLRGALPQARAAGGDWYFELRSPPGPDGSGNRDSAVVARATPDLARVDSVARLAPFDLAEVVTDGRRRLERRLLSGQDRWGVLPDGSLWLARVTENRVDWHLPDGTSVRGTVLPDRVLPVTENDRELFLRRFEDALRPTVEQIPFSAIKPPFENALSGPSGLVWLVKSRAIGDTTRSYQLVDRTGRLVGLASHPGLGRILALGDSVALVGEPFAGGVRLLQFRVPIPPVPHGV